MPTRIVAPTYASGVWGGDVVDGFANAGDAQRPLSTLLLVLRVPLLVLAFFALFTFDFALEGVAVDAARYVAMDRPDQLWLLAGLITLASIALRFCSEATISIVAPSLRSTGTVMWIVAHALPRLIGAALGILLALRFHSILTSSSASDPIRLDLSDGEQTRVWTAAAAYALIGLGIAALPRDFLVRSNLESYSLSDRLRAIDAGSVAAGALLFVTAIAVFFLFWDWRSVEAAQFVGPFGVLVLWAFAAVMYFSPIAIAAHIVRLPLLSLLALAAFAFSALDLNDNHEFRTVEGTNYFEEELSLARWLEERKDIDLDAYESYPVFIVAAEGGGLRAAYFTARVLRTLQTICPAFALHTFAISGVSGGSVGATSFVQLEASKGPPAAGTPACNIEAPAAPDELSNFESDDLHTIYSADHLSPLIGATFFADAFQRFLPFAVSSLDRAKAIECSFERSMFAAAPSFAREPCSDASPRLGDLYGADGRKPTPPYLFLNTTSVTTGAPLPIAPRKMDYRNVGSARVAPVVHSVQRLANGCDFNSCRVEDPAARDLQLSTAAFLSARFPYILPAGRFPAPPPGTPATNRSPAAQRLLDGGLFEDSGTWFAERIARELRMQILAGRSNARRDRVQEALVNARIHVLVIRATPCEKSNPLAFAVGLCFSDVTAPGEEEGLNELASPIRTLLRARVAHGSDALNALCDFARGLERERRDSREVAPVECEPRRMEMERRRGVVTVDEIRFANKWPISVPLTWTLSHAARRHLDAAVAKIPEQYWPGFYDRRQPAGLASVDGFAHVVCLLHLRTGAKLVHGCKPPWPEQTPPLTAAPPRGQGAPAPSLPVPAAVPQPRPAVAPVVATPPSKLSPAPAPKKPPLPELDQCENCAP